MLPIWDQGTESRSLKTCRWYIHQHIVHAVTQTKLPADLAVLAAATHTY